MFLYGALNARFNRCATALPNLNRIKFRRLRQDVGNQVLPLSALSCGTSSSAVLLTRLSSNVMLGYCGTELNSWIRNGFVDLLIKIWKASALEEFD